MPEHGAYSMIGPLRRHPLSRWRSAVRNSWFTCLAPPNRTATLLLDRNVAQVSSRRLARARRRLATAPPLLRRRAGGARLVARFERLLLAIAPEDRQRLLIGSDLRGFLSEVEIWLDVIDAAGDVRDGERRGAGRALDRLFDRISRTEHLAVLLPGGRIDAGFPARASVLALRRIGFALDDLSALLLGAGLAFCRGRVPGTTRLAFREDAEQGRPLRRIDLGMFAGPAGPLGLEWRTGRRWPGPPPLTARMRRGTLTLETGSGRNAAVLPLAASRLRHACDPAWRSRRYGSGTGIVAGSQAPVALVRRASIPGTPILLAPALRSTARSLKVGHDLPGIGDRLARALRLVHLAWPQAHDEVLRRTTMVVPVREPGLVSYSLASRPGVSFINVHGKRTIQLADDLLHETAHHLLHGLQEIRRLLAAGETTAEVQAFDSPWRGTHRPLHGILHGAYTFLFRAELFGRLISACSRYPRVVRPLLGRGGEEFLRRERRRELGMIARALRELDGAARSGLLTRDGRLLLSALNAWHRRLRRPGSWDQNR